MTKIISWSGAMLSLKKGTKLTKAILPYIAMGILVFFLWIYHNIFLKDLLGGTNEQIYFFTGLFAITGALGSGMSGYLLGADMIHDRWGQDRDRARDHPIYLLSLIALSVFANALLCWVVIRYVVIAQPYGGEFGGFVELLPQALNALVTFPMGIVAGRSVTNYHYMITAKDKNLRGVVR